MNPYRTRMISFFKETFSHVENAVRFFQNYLPADISDRLDWETLALQPGKYTDEALRGSESDLLYTVQIDQSPALLYCLFEHQSTPDAWMPLRLLRYILDIWEQYRKQHPNAKKLPPVLPLVLFQGGATWTADLSLSGLIDIPDGLAPYQPEFRHLLVDLNHINADELRGSLIVRASLLALKASRKGLHHELPRLFQLLAELTHQDSSLSMIRTLLRYICTVDNDIALTEYIKQVEATQQPILQEEAMTIAEQLITSQKYLKFVSVCSAVCAFQRVAWCECSGVQRSDVTPFDHLRSVSGKCFSRDLSRPLSMRIHSL